MLTAAAAPGLRALPANEVAEKEETQVADGFRSFWGSIPVLETAFDLYRSFRPPCSWDRDTVYSLSSTAAGLRVYSAHGPGRGARVLPARHSIWPIAIVTWERANVNP